MASVLRGSSVLHCIPSHVGKVGLAGKSVAGLVSEDVGALVSPFTHLLLSAFPKQPSWKTFDICMCCRRMGHERWSGPRSRASLVAETVKNLPECRKPRFDPWVEKIPWRRKWQPTPVFLPRKSYGQTSLAGYGPLHCKELDTTEWLTHTQVLQDRAWEDGLVPGL